MEDKLFAMIYVYKGQYLHKLFFKICICKGTKTFWKWIQDTNGIPSQKDNSLDCKPEFIHHVVSISTVVTSDAVERYRPNGGVLQFRHGAGLMLPTSSFYSLDTNAT